MATSNSLSSEIDHLLEHYLLLLDQYTTLHSQLSSQQISTQQNLARAKFHAPPGVQYGEPMYDGRMQAQRFLHISNTESNGITYEVKKKEDIPAVSEEQKASSAENEKNTSHEPSTDHENEEPIPVKEEERLQANPPKDPLKMFGYTTPSTLKAAQISAVQMVENSIPHLCALDAQMAEVEIKIRRAKKQRGKAEEREAKEKISVEASGVAAKV